jgi:hypothetical protein
MTPYGRRINGSGKLYPAAKQGWWPLTCFRGNFKAASYGRISVADSTWLLGCVGLLCGVIAGC